FYLSYSPPFPSIYTLSLHDALPISLDVSSHVSPGTAAERAHAPRQQPGAGRSPGRYLVRSGSVYLFQIRMPEDIGGKPARILRIDRKSTRLNSSHVKISYAVFCLKK